MAALPPVPQFSAAVQSLLSDGFEPVRALVVSKGATQFKLMNNIEDGAIAALGSSSREFSSGNVEAALASDGMLYMTLVPNLPVNGLSVRVDSAVGKQGALPIAGVEAVYGNSNATIAASASPAAGLVASLTGGSDPFLVGAASMVQPDGKRNTLLGATMGGALTSLVTIPSDGPPLFHQSAVIQPTPATILGGMVEWSSGHPPTVALGAGVSMEPVGLTVKAMLLSGTAERSDGSYPFMVSKLAAVSTLDNGVQMGATVEVPLRVPADMSTTPKWGCMLGINLP